MPLLWICLLFILGLLFLIFLRYQLHGFQINLAQEVGRTFFQHFVAPSQHYEGIIHQRLLFIFSHQQIH